MAMAEPQQEGAEAAAGAARGRWELAALAAAVLLIAAAGFAAYPALAAAPVTRGGLMLILGLAAVVAVGLYALKPNSAAREAQLALRPASEMLEALDAPLALADAAGRLASTNAAWRAAFGASWSAGLPVEAGWSRALYGAYQDARRAGTAEVVLDETLRLRLTPMGRAGYLLQSVGGREAATPVAAVEPAAPAPAAAPAGLDTIASASPFGAAVLAGGAPLEARIVQANPALFAMTAGAAAAGNPFGALLDPASRAEVAGRLAAGAAGVDARLADGRAVQLYVSAVDGGCVVYVVDVTAQKAIELQLVQSQKMQAIGQLAGGVAHDFNNLLMAMQGHLTLLLQRHPLGDPSYEGINQIRQLGVRAADLVGKLLAFSRKRTIQREILDLSETVSEFTVLLRRVFPENVKLEVEYGRNSPLVRADKGALENAVMNLAVNARDAVRANGGGVVRVRTAGVSVEEARALGYDGAQPAEGALALLEVADTGPGIPPEVLEKIFEPFFTTKPVGEGTGLGLATVYGIVKQADGWIDVSNAPGGGAVFRIFLPVHVQTTAAPAVRPSGELSQPKKPAARDLAGKGKILFVEDEPDVRLVTAKLLRASGYEVVEAEDGEQALDYAKAHPGEIDLMISDVMMPGELDGPALLKVARPYLGGVPVVFMSGYAESDFSDVLEGAEGVTFLAKPVMFQDLAAHVKQQLAA